MPLNVGRRRGGVRRGASRAGTRTTRRPAPGRATRWSRSAGRTRSARCRPPWRPGAARARPGCCPRRARARRRGSRGGCAPCAPPASRAGPRSRHHRIGEHVSTLTRESLDRDRGAVRHRFSVRTYTQSSDSGRRHPMGLTSHRHPPLQGGGRADVPRTASTATSSRSTRCGPPTRSGPASSTSTARSTSPDTRRSPRSRSSRPRPGRATAPASTSSSAWRSTAPVVRRGSSRSPAPTRAPATGSRSPCAPTRAASSRKYLVERATPGTMVHLSQAQGEFVLPDQVPEHVLFISGGSGITPVMSMLRSLQRRTHRGRVTFLHYAQSPEHQIFAAELDDDPPLRPRHRRAPAAPRARRPEPVAGLPRAARARLPRRARPGRAARRR